MQCNADMVVYRLDSIKNGNYIICNILYILLVWYYVCEVEAASVHRRYSKRTSVFIYHGYSKPNAAQQPKLPFFKTAFVN